MLYGVKFSCNILIQLGYASYPRLKAFALDLARHGSDARKLHIMFRTGSPIRAHLCGVMRGFFLAQVVDRNQHDSFR